MRRELRNYRTALAMTKEALQQEHAKVDDERARLDCAMANTQGEPVAACAAAAAAAATAMGRPATAAGAL